MLKDNWKKDQISIFLTSCQSIKETIPNNNKQGFLHILVVIIYKANTKNPSNFLITSHINVKKLKTYK